MGTHTAHIMPDALMHLVKAQHFGLAAEALLEFAAVHLHIPGAHHHDGSVAVPKAAAASSTVALEMEKVRTRSP